MNCCRVCVGAKDPLPGPRLTAAAMSPGPATSPFEAGWLVQATTARPAGVISTAMSGSSAGQLPSRTIGERCPPAAPRVRKRRPHLSRRTAARPRPHRRGRSARRPRPIADPWPARSGSASSKPRRRDGRGRASAGQVDSLSVSNRRRSLSARAGRFAADLRDGGLSRRADSNADCAPHREQRASREASTESALHQARGRRAVAGNGAGA